jgi:hypothetical protein
MAAPNRALDINPDLARTAGSELEERTMSLARRLRTDLPIRDTADLEQAVEDRRQIGEAIKLVEDYFEPLTKAAYQTHRLLCDRRNDMLVPLQRVDKMRSAAITDYKADRDREREAHERELAEQQRVRNQEQAAAEAAALESSGQPELAASVLSEAIAAPLPVIALPDDTKAVAGLKFRTYWRWRYAGGPNDVTRTPGPVITRTMNLIPREFLMLDVKKLTAYATAMKAAARVIGIEFYKVDEPTR